MPTRREFVGAAGVAGICTVAGCLGGILGSADDEVGPVERHLADVDLRRISTIPDDESSGVTASVQYDDVAAIREHRDHLPAEAFEGVSDPSYAPEGPTRDAFDRVDSAHWVRLQSEVPTRIEVVHEVLSGAFDPEAYREAAAIPGAPTEEHGGFELYPEGDHLTTGLSSEGLLYVEPTPVHDGEHAFDTAQPARYAAGCAGATFERPEWNRELFEACRPFHTAFVEMRMPLPVSEPTTRAGLEFRGNWFDGEHAEFVHSYAYPFADDVDPLERVGQREFYESLPESERTIEDGGWYSVVRREVATEEVGA